MIVLHGSWCPDADARHGGRFLLWAETQPTTPRRGRPARLSATAPRPHPAHISVGEVRAAWRRLAPGVALPRVESHAVVWLPSSQGRPWPAPEIRLAEGDLPCNGHATLAAWEVAAVEASAFEALRLLATMPEGPLPGLSEVTLGSDLRYWSLAAKLALELLARQQYLPAFLPHGGDRFLAAWEPWLEGPVSAARVARLARAMPPACRAMIHCPQPAGRVRVTPANLATARALLDGFLASAVDGAVRHWAGHSHAGGPSGLRQVVRRWRELLVARAGPGGAPPALSGPSYEQHALHEQYRRWTEALAAGGEGAFRICLRLEEPVADGEEGPAEPSAEEWTLRFFLQANDDPSLLVPAEAVWREAGGALRYLNRRFDEPQERLLRALGEAARVFPTLERGLRTARPTACSLSTEEAYAFLREAAPILERAGYGVLVPPWWSQRTARLGLRLRVSPPATATGILSLESLVQYDWLLSLGGEPMSQEEFLRLAGLKVPLVRVRGQWVELRPEQIEAMLRFWRERAQRTQGTLREALSLAQATEQDGGAGPLPLTAVEASGPLRELWGQLSGHEPFALLPQPAGFRGQLRPYQVSGVSWLAFLQRWGLGACLADDMGLGKTIQVLALLLAGREQGRPSGPALLICPTSAVGNWQREAARFAPSLSVLVHHGLGRGRGADLVAEARRQDLVISTYSLLHRDEDALAGVDWDGVILDEAQNIKNASTLQAQAARRLRARYRVALTGTPVENRLGELWAIMDFLNPGYLGSQADFQSRFALPIERYQDPAALRRLRSLVRPFLLRRVKSDPQVIRDLPDKLEMPVYYKLTQEQATLYQAIVDDALQRIAEAQGIERRGLVLSMLLKLKQVCNHPALFLGDGSSLEGRSGKLSRLAEMLEEVLAAQERALVFTQFAAMGGLLRPYLEATLGREVLYLHGGVPQPERERMIRRFQEEPEGPPVFVLSLKAGGTALNLMRANHVFHFDRWWNPAVENQATDRAYRIGQTRNVQVRRFICLGTLEERIAELIESKRALAENVVQGGEGWLTELSTDQLRDLLALRQEAVEG